MNFNRVEALFFHVDRNFHVFLFRSNGLGSMINDLISQHGSRIESFGLAEISNVGARSYNFKPEILIDLKRQKKASNNDFMT